MKLLLEIMMTATVAAILILLVVMVVKINRSERDHNKD